MGLRDLVRTALDAGFSALDDVPETCTYVSISSTTYDASTGVATAVETTATVGMIFSGYAVPEDFKAPRQDRRNVEPNDVKGLVRASQLVGITPRDGDLVRRDDGDWVVISHKTDPAGATFGFQLRRS
jgi:hypothetical protein